MRRVFERELSHTEETEVTRGEAASAESSKRNKSWGIESHPRENGENTGQSREAREGME